MFQSCPNLESLNLSSFNTKSLKQIEGMFNFSPRLNNVIFNDNEDSTLIRNCYNKEHSTRSILDELPSKLFFIFPSQSTIIPPVPTVTVPNAFQPKNLPPPVSSIVKPPVIVPNQDYICNLQ